MRRLFLIAVALAAAQTIGEGCSPAPGGGGGKGGRAGSANGGAGGNAGAPVTCDAAALRAATLDNCPAFANLPAFESGFLQLRCGKPTVCHMTGVTNPPKIYGIDMWKGFAGLKNVKPTALCPDDYFVNLAEPARSTLLTKNLTPPPGDPPAIPPAEDPARCPSDGVTVFGYQMPFVEPVKLTDAELACVTDYVNAIAAHCRF